MNNGKWKSLTITCTLLYMIYIPKDRSTVTGKGCKNAFRFFKAFCGNLCRFSPHLISGHPISCTRMRGAEALRRHLNFHLISHMFTLSFTNPSFQDLNGSHIMYWNMMILNPSRFKVEPHSKYWYFCIERVDLLSLRFSENAMLFHI